MSLSIKHKIHLQVEYEHRWIHQPLNLIFKINDRVINVDVSGKNTVTIDKVISLAEGDYKFLLCCDNKDDNHTRIDGDQTIIEDSYAKFTKFFVDDINLMQFVKRHSYFISKNNEKITPTAGIWANGSWCMDFKIPVYDWFLESLFL